MEHYKVEDRAQIYSGVFRLKPFVSVCKRLKTALNIC